MVEAPIEFVRIDDGGADRAALIEFGSANEFPFHIVPRPTVADIEARIAAGTFNDHDHASYWIDLDGMRIGMVTVDGLDDGGPQFDIRLAESFRGRGLGVRVLVALTRLVFETMPTVLRFEGQTRHDNLAMRNTFRRAGWVKEAHYRQAWPSTAGIKDSIGYAILRSDWESGTTTQVPWGDD